MKKEKKYQINNISEKQLGIIMDALEMYSRLGLMQFDKLIDHAFGFGHIINKSNNNIYDSYLKNKNEIDRYVTNIKDCLIENDDDIAGFAGCQGWSLGIGHPKVSMPTKISYEMEKDIDIFLSQLEGNRTRGKLKFSKEDNLIINEQNERIDKLTNILKNIKNE